MNKETPNIMIVEDQAVLAYDLLDRLKEYGFNQLMGPYNTGEKALTACDKKMPDIAILDIRLAGKMDGIQLAKELNIRSSVFIIYLTQQEDEETFNASAETEHIAYINKPFTNNEIRSALLRAVKKLDLLESSQPNLKRETPKKVAEDDLKVLNLNRLKRGWLKFSLILLKHFSAVENEKSFTGVRFSSDKRSSYNSASVKIIFVAVFWRRSNSALSLSARKVYHAVSTPFHCSRQLI